MIVLSVQLAVAAAAVVVVVFAPVLMIMNSMYILLGRFLFRFLSITISLLAFFYTKKTHNKSLVDRQAGNDSGRPVSRTLDLFGKTKQAQHHSSSSSTFFSVLSREH